MGIVPLRELESKSLLRKDSWFGCVKKKKKKGARLTKGSMK